MFKVLAGGLPLEYSTLLFSGGEVQVKLDGLVGRRVEIDIDARLTSSAKIMELAMLVDALRRAGARGDIHLLCPYLPYARQDRVCAPGEALALKVMCDMINAMNFTTVTVWDVHSDVAMALLDRARCVPQAAFVASIKRLRTYILVAPDAGAIKKTMESANLVGAKMVRADKIRNVHDGAISGTRVYSEDVGSIDFLVVDDICDGGRTFIELAKELRNLTKGNLLLYVTHGIFSKGVEAVLDLYDHIYVANPWPAVVEFAEKNPHVLTIVR